MTASPSRCIHQPWGRADVDPRSHGQVRVGMFRPPHSLELSAQARLLFVSLVVHACNVPRCPAFRLVAFDSLKEYLNDAVGMHHNTGSRALRELEERRWVRVIQRANRFKSGQWVIEIPKLRNHEQMQRPQKKGGKEKRRPPKSYHLSGDSPEESYHLTGDSPESYHHTGDSYHHTGDSSHLAGDSSHLTGDSYWRKMLEGKKIASPQKEKEKQKKKGTNGARD